MRGYMSLLRKEIKEQFRTNKVIIVAIVFLFFGLLNPVMTKYLPDILSATSSTSGLVIDMPEPVSSEALLSYASSITQFGVLVAVLMTMGAIAKEIESGTAAIVLSKPVSRLSFILAKLLAEGLNLLLGLLLGGLACLGCTLILFGDAYTLGFVYQLLLLALFMVFCLAVTLFFSSLMKNQLAAGGLAITTIIVISILSYIPKVAHFLPGGLISWGNELVMGVGSSVEWGAMALSVVFTGLCVYGTWLNLRRKEL